MSTTATRSLVLFFGLIISTVVSALTVIVVARTIGSISYGEYSKTLIPISIALLFQDIGIGSAITRYCARNRQEGGEYDPRIIAQIGLIFGGVTSAILSLAIYIFAAPIATSLLHQPNLEFMVRVASFAVFGNGIYNAAQSVFVGYELMSLRSVLQVVWSIVRGALALIFVYLGMSSYGVILSYMLSYVMTGLLGVVLVLVFVKFDAFTLPKNGFQVLRSMLTYSFPAYVGDLVAGGLTQWNNSLMTLYIATEFIGNYFVAVNFAVLVSFFSAPIGTVIFPIFSKLKRDETRLRELFNFSVKYTHLIVTPVVLLLILLSTSLIHFIYGQSYPYTSLYLKLYLILYLFEGVGETVINYTLLGLGETKVILVSNIITLGIGIPLAYYLVPQYQIIGLITVMIIAPQFGWLFKWIWLKRNSHISINWFASIKVYVIGIVATIISYFFISYFNEDLIKLVSGSIVFFFVYIGLLSITKTLTLNDISYLSEFSESVGPISPVMNFVISIMKKLILF